MTVCYIQDFLDYFTESKTQIILLVRWLDTGPQKQHGLGSAVS